MTNNLDLADQHAALVITALDGESAAMRLVGHVEDDDNPVRMLAVALAHAQAAIVALAEESRELRNEVDRLRGDRAPTAQQAWDERTAPRDGPHALLTAAQHWHDEAPDAPPDEADIRRDAAP